MNNGNMEAAGRMWLRAIKGHRTAFDLTLPCMREAPLQALAEAMHQLDLSMPVWLPRHQADWDRFSLARLLPEHFVDAVNFERIELSYIAPEDENKPKMHKAE